MRRAFGLIVEVLFVITVVATAVLLALDIYNFTDWQWYAAIASVIVLGVTYIKLDK